jgi:TP901 family phage tail tape measure protein
MADNFGVNAKVSIDVIGVKQLNDLNNALAKLASGEDLTARETSILEKALKQLAAAQVNNTVQTKQAAAAEKALTDAYKADEAAARRTEAATKAAAAARQQYNNYVNTSNRNVAAAEARALADAEKAAKAEISAKAAALRADKAATDAAAAATQKYNAYVRASNLRIAAQEARALADAKHAVARESAEAAKALAAEARAVAQAEAATRRAAASTADHNINLASQRYALYAVAGALGTVSAATLGLVVATESVGIAFEKNFASVERTSGAVGEELDHLRDQLIAISTTMPIAFGDVTSIATLGAQLGIAEENLGTFTETVGQFAATTDVSVEAAATGFGRLAQLTKIPTEDIGNLGAAIYQVGINSVATESQILSVAQQIAVSGNLAGFSAEQIVALSGALASLGVQPEAARGSIMRIFNNITASAAEGGDAVAKFAAVAGMASEDFAQAWRDNPQAAFSAFIKGLGEAGQKASGILNDVGIRAIRDQRALQLLASNTDVYNQALADSSSAYAEGTALADGYGIVADTLAAKLQVLGQTLLALGDAAADLGPIKTVVNALEGAAKAALAFVGTPVGKVIASVVIGITALVGVAAGLGAGFALLTASAFALRQVLTGLTVAEGTTVLGMKAMVTELVALKIGQDRATAGVLAYNAALQQNQGRLAATAAAARAASVSLASVTAAARGLASATLIGAGITAALIGIAKAVDYVDSTFDTASDKAKAYFGDLGGLADAMKKDTVDAFNGTSQSIRLVEGAVKSSTTTLAPWAVNLGTSANAQVKLTEVTGQTTTAIREQVVAIGENSKAWLANTIANNENFQKAFQANQQALQDAGFSLADFLNSALEEEGGGSKYLTDMAQHIMEVDAAAQEAKTGAEVFVGAVGSMSPEAERAVRALKSLGEGAYATDGAFATAASQAEFTNAVNQALNITVEDGAEVMDDSAAATGNATDALADFANAQLDAVNSVYALGESLAANGDSFDIYSVNGRNNLAALNETLNSVVALAGGNSEQLAVYLQSIMSALAAHGINSVAQLGAVGERIGAIISASGMDMSKFQGIASGVANTLNSGYAGGMAKVARNTSSASKATRELAKEIRTFSDYADDVEKVADAAFNLRHGLQEAKDELADFIAQLKEDAKEAKEELKKDPVSIRDIFDAKTEKRAGLDSILSAYRDLVEQAKDAKDALRDAKNEIKDTQATLSGLGADKSVLEYQLKIAQKYGDTLRAQQIQAELAKNAADQAKAQAELAEAQEAARKAAQDQNKTLKGNSSAAVNNRNKVRGLQGEYVDYIQSLIDAGASQEEINKAVAQSKEDFLAQGVALGYSAEELQQYVTIFDSYTRKQQSAEAATRKEAEAHKNSAQAKRDDRDALNELYQKYQDYITKLIESGASEAEIQAAIRKSKEEFIRLGTQLGYSRTDIDNTAASFDDLRTVVNRVPKNVNVKLENDPGVRAFKEWVKKKDSKTVTPKIAAPKTGYYSQGRAAGNDWAKGWADAQGYHRKPREVKDAKIPGGKKWTYDGKNFFFKKGGVVPEYHANGGQVGHTMFRKKGTDTVPAMLTPREYVMTTDAVDHWGLPFMNAINNQQVPQQLFGGSGGGGSSVSFPSTLMVELSPVDRQIIRDSGGAIVVLDGQVLANAVNRRNANSSVRGAA